MKKIVFFILSIMIVISCDNSSKDERIIICTEVFETKGIKVQYPDESPVKLDSFKVYWNGNDVTISYNEYQLISYQEEGVYPVVDDGLRKELWGLQEPFRFVGYINNIPVIDRSGIMVGANECHVNYYGEEPLVYTYDPDQNYPCTEELRMYDITVQYDDESFVHLDSIRVMWKDRDITPQKSSLDDYFISMGRYVIITDAMRGELAGLTATIKASGYIQDKEVFNEEYLFSADRCHVYRADQKSSLIVLKK